MGGVLLLVTVLVPADPAIVTVNVGSIKVAVIELVAATVTVQVRAEAQLGTLHPLKSEVAAGFAVRIT